MRSTLAALGVAAAAALVGDATVRVSASTGPIPLNCDRACLEGVITQYLTALVAHDPKRLPLAARTVFVFELPDQDGRGDDLDHRISGRRGG